MKNYQTIKLTQKQHAERKAVTALKHRLKFPKKVAREGSRATPVAGTLE